MILGFSFEVCWQNGVFDPNRAESKKKKSTNAYAIVSMASRHVRANPTRLH